MLFIQNYNKIKPKYSILLSNMPTLNLKQLFNLRALPKRVIITCQLLEIIDTNKYKIRDKSEGFFQLDVSEAKIYMKKYIKVGEFLKIIHPRIEKETMTLHIGPKTLVSLGSEIDGLMEIEFKPFQTIQSTFEMDGKAVISGKILAKVVKINACQKIETRYGLRNRYSCEIKDIVGSRQRVTFWRKTSDEMCVELNKSYIFSKLVLENFPEEKPHFLLCARDEDVSLASDDFQNQMKSIESWDKQFEGMVLAIHSTLTYISCPFCKRSLKQADFKDGDKCGRIGCNKIVETAVKDYSFVVVVENGNSDELSITSFRNYLPINGTFSTERDLEKLLRQQYEGKKIKGKMTEKKKAVNDIAWTMDDVTLI